MPIITSADVTIAVTDDTTIATIRGECYDLTDAFLAAVNGRGAWTAPLWGELCATAWERRWADLDEDAFDVFADIAHAAGALAGVAGAPAQPGEFREVIEHITVTGTTIRLASDQLVITGRPEAVLRRLRAMHAEPGGLDGARLQHAAAVSQAAIAAEQLCVWETSTPIVTKPVEIVGRPENGAVLDDEDEAS